MRHSAGLMLLVDPEARKTRWIVASAELPESRWQELLEYHGLSERVEISSSGGGSPPASGEAFFEISPKGVDEERGNLMTVTVSGSGMACDMREARLHLDPITGELGSPARHGASGRWFIGGPSGIEGFGTLPSSVVYDGFYPGVPAERGVEVRNVAGPSGRLVRSAESPGRAYTVRLTEGGAIEYRDFDAVLKHMWKSAWD